MNHESQQIDNRISNTPPAINNRGWGMNEERRTIDDKRNKQGEKHEGKNREQMTNICTMVIRGRGDIGEGLNRQ